MNIWQKLLAKQLGQNWTDRTPRGGGNRAARRAFAVSLAADPFLRSNLNEPIAEYPRIIVRGAILTDCCTSAETAIFSRQR